MPEELKEIKEKEAEEKGTGEETQPVEERPKLEEIEAKINAKLNMFKEKGLLSREMNFGNLLAEIDELEIRLAGLEAELTARKFDSEKFESLRKQLEHF